MRSARGKTSRCSNLKCLLLRLSAGSPRTFFIEQAKGWNNGGSYYLLNWLVAADERTSISHSSAAFCELLYKHAPDDLMDLFYAFEKHCYLINHARHDLCYMLEKLRSEESTTGPRHMAHWHSD